MDVLATAFYPHPDKAVSVLVPATFATIITPSGGDIDNTAVVVGDTVTLAFTTSGVTFINWQEFVTDSSGQLIYGQGILKYTGDASIAARYSLAEVGGESNFSISNVQLGDGGTYKVKNLASAAPLQAAEVIVLGR